MGILFNEVERKDLRAGDHIYSWRTAYTYAHHGIFVGDDDVVHFTRGSGQEIGAGVSLINSFASTSIPKQHLSCPRSPDSCGLQYGNSGVIRSCLDCFLEGGAVHRFEYGVSKAVFLAQVRGGTCTLAQSDPPEEVIHRAMYLHKHGFGNYDLFCNNCEDFAIYCRTEYIVKRKASGRSGQVAAMDGVRSASRLAYENVDMLNRSLSLALVVGTYFYKRYVADIGVRVDKTKVPVKDLATFLDSSTCIGLVLALIKLRYQWKIRLYLLLLQLTVALIKLRYEWKMWLYFLILLLVRSFKSWEIWLYLPTLQLVLALTKVRYQ